MIRRLVHRKLDALERELGASLDYLRFVLDRSLRAFLAFLKFTKLAEYRRELPPEPRMVASIRGSLSEDCGTCVQIAVNLARQAGLSADLVRATLDGRPEALPEDLADVCRYADAVLAHEDDPELRETLRARYGDEGLIELGYALASAKVFPVVKRSLGFAVSCSQVEVRV